MGNVHLKLNGFYRDAQQNKVVAYCKKCGGEIYSEFFIMPGGLCLECFDMVKNEE